MPKKVVKLELNQEFKISGESFRLVSRLPRGQFVIQINDPQADIDFNVSGTPSPAPAENIVAAPAKSGKN